MCQCVQCVIAKNTELLSMCDFDAKEMVAESGCHLIEILVFFCCLPALPFFLPSTSHFFITSLIFCFFPLSPSLAFYSNLISNRSLWPYWRDSKWRTRLVHILVVTSVMESFFTSKNNYVMFTTNCNSLRKLSRADWSHKQWYRSMYIPIAHNVPMMLPLFVVYQLAAELVSTWFKPKYIPGCPSFTCIPVLTCFHMK